MFTSCRNSFKETSPPVAMMVPKPGAGQIDLHRLSLSSCPNVDKGHASGVEEACPSNLPSTGFEFRSGWPSRNTQDLQLVNCGAGKNLASQIVSHYRIIRKLGAGGMGEVFLAEDTRLDRKVAIKWLHAKAMGSEQARKRLIREAKTAATLDHPNICTIHEIGEEGDRAFIVMQYVEGETLAGLLDNEPPNLQESVDIAAQVAEALTEAHSHGVVHRDIKPQNVIITPRGQVKVLDFGLAKLLQLQPIDTQNDTLTLLTDTGMAIGTVHYMSPEQARGERVDARSDLFALGALLYKCITGRTAFSGNNAIDVCAQVIHVDPSPPSQINPAVPLEVERIVLKALTKNIDARYQSANEMLIDLRGFQRTSLKSRKKNLPQLTGEAATARARSLAGFFDRSRQSFRARAVVAIVLPIAILAAWLALHNRHISPHQPTPEAKRWYEEGANSLRDGAYYQASKALEQAIEMDSKFVLAHARLADAYAEIDYTDKAKDELLIATTLAPDRSALAQTDASYLDAISATVTRDFETAVEHYSKIALGAADSEKASVYVDLGRSYEKNENLDKAIESYLEAAKSDRQSAVALLRLGIAYGRQQDLKRATEEFEKAERIYQDLSNQEGITEVLYQRGSVLNKTGRSKEALNQLETALSMTQTTKNNYQQIKILLQLSNLHCNGGDTAQGEKLAKEAIDIAQADQVETLATDGLIDLGNAFLFRGDYTPAEKYFRQALDFARRKKARRNEARALLQLGSLNVQRENPDEAVPYIEQALDFYRPGGYHKDTSRALILLGRAYRQKGSYETALQIFEQQLQLATDLRDPSQIAISHQSIGILLTEDQERYPEALLHIEESSRIHESIGAMSNLGYDLMNRGTLLWQLGRYDEAQGVLQKALSIANSHEAGYKELSAWVYLSDAQMALSRRRFPEAKAKSQQALTLANTQFKEIAIRANSTLGLARALSGEPHPGRPLCQRAVTMARDASSPKLLSDMLLALAEAMVENHDARDSLKLALEAQARFEHSGQQDSEWHAWLIAARASQLAGDKSTTRNCASRANSLLSSLQQKWGAEAYALYAARPDAQAYRKQLNQLLAINQ